jgi:carbon-monoxide dehydrogenase medium subunit
MFLKTVEYTRPDTVDEALGILGSNDGAAPLAGGQSLVNVLKHRVASVELLVDISSIEELRALRRGAAGALEIGACVTYDELDQSSEVRSSHRILSDVASHIEDVQIRNRGTIGGNCCLSDPTNNLPPLLVALDAQMNIRSVGRSRHVPAQEFFKGYFYTALEPGELLTSITLPGLPPGTGVGYSSLNVAPDAKTIVRSAARVRVDGTIQDVRIVLARIAAIPIRYSTLEDALRGVPPTEDAIRAASESVPDNLDAVADVHASSQYRQDMARVVARRAVLEAVLEATR